MLDNRRDINKLYFYAPFVLFVILKLPSFILVLPNWSDIGLYKFFAESILAGQTPYFDFKVEYPPLTLIFFVIPGLLAKLFGGFEIIYRLEMALFDLGCLALIGPIAHQVFKADKRGVFVSRLAYLILGAVSFQFLLDRFDIAVVFLIMLSIYLALVREKWSLAYIVLWAATLVKIFPIILFPLLIMLQLKQSKNAKRPLSDIGRSLGFLILALTVLQVMFGSWWEMVTSYHGTRGIQIESIYSSIILIARGFGMPATLNHEFGAYQITNAFSGQMASAALFIVFGSILLLYYGFRRLMVSAMDITRRQQSLVKAALAALLLFIILNKVLSPQYLLWLFPLAAVVSDGHRRFSLVPSLMIFIALATAVLFPYNYVDLLTLKPAAMILLNARNALLLVLVALTVTNLFYKNTGGAKRPVKTPVKRPGGQSRKS